MGFTGSWFFIAEDGRILSMSYFTKEQIEKARSVDLLTYLQTYEPTELVKLKGNTYCTREHSSLKISNGKWMWWSRGFGGVSALDYLIKVKGLSFMDAMKILTKENDFTPKTDEKVGEKGKSEENRKLLLPERNYTNDHVIRYLSGRGIDGNLIEACINKGVLYESRSYHNCIFLGFDEHRLYCRQDDQLYRRRKAQTGRCS